MNTIIFLRSYAADLPWVPYALRSIHKFVSGVRDIIISVPEEDLQAFKGLNLAVEKLVQSKVPTGAMDPYLGQQLDKLMADEYTNADYILYWDSDCIAIRPFKPHDLLVERRPRCLMTPYSKLVKPDGSSDTPWQAVTEKAVDHTVEFEFMRSHPFIVSWFALGEFREFMQNTHGCSVGEYIAKQPGRSFSEFNALHAWAYYRAPHLFYWWNTEIDGVPEPLVKQWWSWGGITPEIRAEMERILA